MLLNLILTKYQNVFKKKYMYFFLNRCRVCIYLFNGHRIKKQKIHKYFIVILFNHIIEIGYLYNV